MSEQGLNMVKKSEGFREFAYPDPASDLARQVRARGLRPRWGYAPAREIIHGLPAELRGLNASPWTCGYGETQGVDIDTAWSEAEASQKLRYRYGEFQEGVLRLCSVTPNDNQLAAMTSLAYNIGLSGFAKSTVLKAHNRGDTQAAARAFGLWNKAGGREEPGLTRRRAEESALYLQPMPHEPEHETPEMPQRVDPESGMTQSPINRAGVVAGGTAAVATVAETARTVSDVKYSVQSLGDWLVPILLLVVVGLCAYVVWQRISQRRGGWS